MFLVGDLYNEVFRAYMRKNDLIAAGCRSLSEHLTIILWLADLTRRVIGCMSQSMMRALRDGDNLVRETLKGSHTLHALHASAFNGMDDESACGTDILKLAPQVEPDHGIQKADRGPPLLFPCEYNCSV